MPAIATIVSLTAGLDGPMTFTITSSPTVVAQGLGVGRIGDLAIPHKRYGSKTPHPVITAMGSPTVIVNGLAAAAEGSLMSCGDMIILSPAQTVQIGL